jgi:AcrR family transcriptional regulator
MARERSDAILRAAERVLAEDDDATMVDVAQAAGVGRTTLYRYFPGMDELRVQLVQVAATDAARRLRSAGLHRVGFEEGLCRAVRALVEVGDSYFLLVDARVVPEPEQVAEVREPLLELFARARREGVLRLDVPNEWLLEAIFALVTAGLRSRKRLGLTDDRLVATVTDLLLSGLRTPYTAAASSSSP